MLPVKFAVQGARTLHPSRLSSAVRPSVRLASSHGSTSPRLPVRAAIVAALAAAGLAFSLSSPLRLDSSAQTHAVKASPGETLPLLTREEVEDNEEGLWVVIDNVVYDVTDFLDLHPGGSQIIKKNSGKDVTKIFKPIHPPTAIKDNQDHVKVVGRVEALAAGADDTEEERAMREARENLPHVDTVVNLKDFEKACRGILSPKAAAYYSSGADDERALRTNEDSFSRILLKPRALRKVKDVSCETTILGKPSASPIYISPAALARLGSEDGEMHLTRGAAQAGIIQVISSNASCSLDELSSVRKPNQPLFWQYYVAADRERARANLKTALSHDMDSIWVTVDAPVGGKREADLRVQLKENPPTNEKQEKGGSTSEQMFSFVDPNLCWEDLKWIREASKGKPLVIKGIGSVEDAVMAIEAGVDGMVISNHGGRQLEGGIPPIRVLERLQAQHGDLLKSSGVEIFVDGGITRGSQVVKALCLGAKAVGIGRPFLYAQSAWGTEGTVKACSIMEDEIKLTMRLMGVTSLDQLGPEYVEVLPM